MPAVPILQSTVINSGTALSATVNLSSLVLVGIQLPAAWDAANITFLHSTDNSTFQSVFGPTAEYALTSPAANLYITVDGAAAAANVSRALTHWVQIRSGTSATPVNQTANRTLTLVLLPRLQNA
jgi:hypothetical protein